MLIRELIHKLEHANPDAQVFIGFDDENLCLMDIAEIIIEEDLVEVGRVIIMEKNIP